MPASSRPPDLATRLRRRAGRVARALGLRRSGRTIVRGRLADRVKLRSAMVEDFKPNQVSGWVSVEPGAPAVIVRLKLNGDEIVRTRAVEPTDREDPGGEVRRFRFMLRELPRYIGPDDRLTVEVDGTALPINGAGTRFRAAKQGEFTAADLNRQLAQGYVLNRDGDLQRSKKNDTRWQQDVTGIAERVQEFLSREFGYDAFYTYGTMLGAVREGGFIGHDDDLDLAYLSRHTDPAKIGPELREIALALIEAGWIVEGFTTHLHILAEFDGRMERVDLFAHFFDDAGLLRFPWGMAGTTHVRAQEWAGVHDVPFEDGTARVPVNAEAVLTQLYGAGWREPQPSFNWKLDRTERAADALMSRDHCDEIYWVDWHRRHSFDEPSPFFEVISTRPDCPRTVIDVGCGEGRDAIAFARTGRRVFAVDRSAAGLAKVEAKRAAAGAEALVELRNADLRTDAFRAVLAEAVAAGGAEPVLFYLRFLLHAWRPERDKPVLDILRAVARPGDVFAAEFRSSKDKGLPKTHVKAYRSYRDGPELVQRLRYDYGMTILQADRRTGRSPYGVEDPDLFRIVGRWGERPGSGPVTTGS